MNAPKMVFSPPSSRWPRHALGLALLLAILGFAMTFADRLLYFPQRITMTELVAQTRAHGFAPWPAESDYRGLIRSPTQSPVGTVVVFHGNAGHAGDRLWYYDAFASRGLRVILAEYPGYGPRDGSLREAPLVADARDLIAYVHATFPGALMIAGESLGAGVAAAAVATIPVNALLLITPWNDLASVARHHYPWLPVNWLLRDRYDSGQNLQKFRGRIGVIIAQTDAIIPPALADALFDSLSTPKQRWVVPDAGHNDWMDRVDATTWNAVLDFLLRP